jgi:hypothetical protein
VKTTILFLAGILLVSLNSFAQNGSKISWNKTYKVRVVENYHAPDSGSRKAKITFKDNRIYFHDFSDNWDFTYTPYTISVDSNTQIITFNSDVTDDSWIKRKLSGTITGDVIEGTIVITTTDGVKWPSSFSGKLKK